MQTMDFLLTMAAVKKQRKTSIQVNEDENESSDEEPNEIMDYAVAENDTMLGLQSKWSDDDE